MRWGPTLLATALAGSCLTAPAAAAPLVRARVDPSQRGTPIARHFLGISTEYRDMLRLLGQPRIGSNPVARQLLANLDTESQGMPVVRIGGGTADSAWWNPTQRPRPNGVQVNLTGYNREAIYDFQRATGAPLILDLNFAANQVSYARDWALAALERLGPDAIRAFEIGNEPDVYARGRPYGDLPRTRPKGYSLRDYSRELRPFTRSLSRLPGHPTLAGPGTCCGRWDHGISRLVRWQKRRLGLLTFHVYPMSACSRAEFPVTLANLLSDKPIQAVNARFAKIRQQAARAHRGVRITETNSAACGGKPGISDSYAASLWMTDWMFLLAAQGFEGVNVHISGAYAPFAFGYETDHFVGHVAGPYYGMLLFARAIADHSRLLPLTTLAAKSRPGVPVHVWATADRHGHARVVVVNKDRKRSGVAAITVRDARGDGTLERLTAPSLTTSSGIALGGLGIPEGTTDGRLVGSPTATVVSPRRTTYRFRMPAASAAILTVRIPADPFS